MKKKKSNQPPSVYARYSELSKREIDRLIASHQARVAGWIKAGDLPQTRKRAGA